MSDETNITAEVDPRHTPHLVFEKGPTHEPVNDAVLIDGRIIALDYLELGKSYELTETSDHPYLLEKGIIHADDGYDAHVSVEGLLIRGIWADDGHAILNPTYVRLDAFGKTYRFDGRGAKAYISAVDIEVELPIAVPGHGGIQFKVWLRGNLSHVTATVDLEVTQVKAVGRWNGTVLNRRPDEWAEDVRAGSWFDQWFYENQPIEGYRVRATRISSPSERAYFAQREAERQA